MASYNILLVSYDLIKEESSEDYKALIDKIKSYGSWAKPLESFWLIKTEKSASEMRDELRSVTDSNDEIVVLNVTGDNWATFGISKEVTDWMHQNL